METIVSLALSIALVGYQPESATKHISHCILSCINHLQEYILPTSIEHDSDRQTS